MRVKTKQEDPPSSQLTASNGGRVVSEGNVRSGQVPWDSENRRAVGVGAGVAKWEMVQVWLSGSWCTCG
jgi:hypothetical protein